MKHKLIKDVENILNTLNMIDCDEVISYGHYTYGPGIHVRRETVEKLADKYNCAIEISQVSSYCRLSVTMYGVEVFELHYGV